MLAVAWGASIKSGYVLDGVINVVSKEHKANVAPQPLWHVGDRKYSETGSPV
jgi:hypothetical protein